MATKISNLIGLVSAGVGGALVARSIVRRSRHFDLHNRTAVVTGGARGLGLAIARQLVRRGARVAICSRDEAQLRSAQTELLQIGPPVLAVTCDVTDAADVERFLGVVQAEFGAIDVLVNNAGTISVGPMEEMTLDDYELAMQTHFWAPLKLSLQVLPQMRRRRSGRIVNIASFGGKIPAPHLLPYAASKFALVGLSEGMRAELTRHGVYVMTVCPGLIRTGSPRNANFKGRNEEEYAWFTTGDVTPIVSINADRLARQIVDATVNGDAELISPWPARLQTALHGVFPGISAEAAAMVNRLLPEPGGSGMKKVKGFASQSGKTPRAVQRATDAAARSHNEF